MKIAVLTLGCRSNQAESAQIEADALRYGHILANASERADICVINTCTVTEKADAQCRRMISKALKAGQRVIVTGCSAEMNRKKLLKAFPEIELFGNEDKQHIINKIGKSSERMHGFTTLPSRHRPIVKVQDGCDNFCSYCVVPYARGRSRSRSLHEVIAEVVKLESGGFNEIVLSGIHLGMYGKDHSFKSDLSHLLKELLLKTKMPRIRLSSLEVNEIHSELLEVLSEERICNHMHLPLQSGHDRILKAMNRRYSVHDYEQCVLTIWKRNPDISLGADVLVGFPGEDDKSFDEAESFIKNLPLSYLHVFPYSRREGTPAAKMQRQIPENIKKKRSQRLRQLGALKRKDFIRSQAGKIETAIVESVRHGECCATTGNYIKVVFQSREHHAAGSLVTVRFDEGFSDFSHAHEENNE
ncbi:MAG TPA: tRNA (N(6)-L-threonylcarbamoyladenosine(37)-C(2))-methylthiotransferase MtaB [Dissulfurispiraceae bacterium]|nr:tRNA (N(6)-L-threonylcarbamoyladenosine(37)-C(2))-methylthiotransferase MtaB [Dissulfurispiraceae bacterium]